MLRQTREQTSLSSLFSSTWEDFFFLILCGEGVGKTRDEPLTVLLSKKSIARCLASQFWIFYSEIYTSGHVSLNQVNQAFENKTFNQTELFFDTVPLRKSWWALHPWHIQTGCCSWELRPENTNQKVAGNRCKCINGGWKVFGILFTVSSA